MLTYDTKTGHTSDPRWRSGAANNTKPTVNIPTVNVPTLIIPTVDIPTVTTQKNNMRGTTKQTKNTHPWHAIRASVVADIAH